MAKAKFTEQPDVTEAASSALIIRKKQKGSSRLILTPTITNDVTKETTPGIDITFEAETFGMWHSDFYTPPPNVLRYYGDKQKVIEAIHAAMQRTMQLDPDSYEYLTQDQYLAIAGQESNKALLQRALEIATASPDSSDAMALLEAAKNLTAQKTVVKRGAIKTD
jgi:hypothetical protein